MLKIAKCYNWVAKNNNRDLYQATLNRAHGSIKDYICYYYGYPIDMYMLLAIILTFVIVAMLFFTSFQFVKKAQMYKTPALIFRLFAKTISLSYKINILITTT